MRVAILGGAFNPPHKGHIELARFILDNCPQIDEACLMPCKTHVFNKQLIPFKQRYEMCILAVEGYSKLNVSDFEHAYNCSNTYDMLSKFEVIQTLAIPYMIIGMDEALQIQKWINWELLIKRFKFIVVDRAGIETPNNAWFKNGHHIYLNDLFDLIPPISSSRIRSTICDFDDRVTANYFLNPSVLSYIKENKLYGSIDKT